MSKEDKYSQITTEELIRKKDTLWDQVQKKREEIFKRIDETENLCSEIIELELIINGRQQPKGK